MRLSRHLLSGLTATVLLLGGGAVQVQAALGPAVNGMVYDDVLDLCWLQDVSTSGPLTWDGAVVWAEALEHGGHSDWRLARMSTSSSAASVFDCSSGTEQDCIDSGNELGYMFYHNLPGGFPKTGNQVPFTNIPNGIWSGAEYAPYTGSAWNFNAYYGVQYFGWKGYELYGWAVRSGQCQVVPEPEPIPAISAWGLGLLSLLLLALGRARLR